MTKRSLQKPRQAVGCAPDQYHTHVANNSAHTPLVVTAAEVNPKESSETLLPASPRRKSPHKDNHVDILLESTLRSPPLANGQLMQTPQKDVTAPHARDSPISIHVDPEAGASESLSSINVDRERVWDAEPTNHSETGSDYELELQYPSDADLEVELELSRMTPEVPSSEPNICIGCKKTFSCQEALTVSFSYTSNCDILLMVSPLSRHTVRPYLSNCAIQHSLNPTS